MKKNRFSSTIYAVLVALCVFPAFVWSQAYVLLPNGNKVQVERIAAKPDGTLVVTVNGKPQELLVGQYTQAVGIKPAEIDQAQALINEGETEEATELLSGVVQNLRFQSWDAFAGEKLATLQLAEGEPLEAKRTVDRLQRRYGDETTILFPFLEKILWNVQVQTGAGAGLEEELTVIMNDDSSSIERKSRALIVRGDIKASRKDYQAAVLDYLRANYFYGENPDVQAEALYKSASMFAKIGDTGRLRKYSSLLKSKYPDSEYANREIGS